MWKLAYLTAKRRPIVVLCYQFQFYRTRKQFVPMAFLENLPVLTMTRRRIRNNVIRK